MSRCGPSSSGLPGLQRHGAGCRGARVPRRPPGGDPGGRRARLRLPPGADRRSALPRALHGDDDERARARRGGGEELRDPRAEALAKILVGYSTEVKEGEVVSIDGESAAEPLLLAVYEEVLKAGANPILNVALDGQSATYFKHASDAQLGWISPIAEWMVEHADVRIAIGASTNTRELSAVPPERQTRRQTATGDLMARAMERSAAGDFRWCYTLYPTSAYASEAEMSLADYEDFYFGACLATTGGDPLTAWERGLGRDEAARRVDRGPRGGSGHRAGDRHHPRHRRPQVHPLRRPPQHARRRVLHRAGRGLGAGRGHLPPARGDRRARGLRGAAALRGRHGRRRQRRARRGVPDQAARHRPRRASPRRAGDRHQLRDRPRHPRGPARREDRRHRPHGGRPQLPRVGRRERVSRPHRPGLRPPPRRQARSRRRRSCRKTASSSSTAMADTG